MIIENTSVPQAEHQAAKPRDPLDVPHISLEEFLVALHPVRLEGLLELLALPSKKQKFVDPHDWRTPRTVRGFSRRRQNLYFGVATRKNDKSGAAENCLRLPALFADIDADDADDLTEGLRRLAEFPLAPSCVVRSGGGLHAYWLLDQPLDVSTPDARTTAKALLRRLAAHLGADLASAEVARVLRLPGS